MKETRGKAVASGRDARFVELTCWGRSITEQTTPSSIHKHRCQEAEQRAALSVEGSKAVPQAAMSVIKAETQRAH